MKSPSAGSGQHQPWADTRTAANGCTVASNFQRWFAGSCVVTATGVPRVLFHGTNQPVEAFLQERLGASTQSVSSVLGFWFTDSAAVAEDYANKAGRHVIAEAIEHEKKTELLLKKMEAAERRGDWDLVDTLTHEIEAHEIPATRQGATGQNIVPVYASIRHPMIVDALGKAHGTGEGAAFIEQALAAGHDGVIFLNTADCDSLAVSNHYVVFDSAQVKSAISNSGLYSCLSSDLSDSESAVVISPIQAAVQSNRRFTPA